MNKDEADQAPEEVVESSQSQVEETNVAEAPDQSAGQAVEQGSSEIVVGNQKFANVDALRKAYESAQKGLTQTTQKYSSQLKAYQQIADWLSSLKKDQKRWSSFMKAVESEGGQGAPEVAQKDDGVYSDLSDRLEKQEATLEFYDFKQRHPDVSKEVLDAVIDKVIERDDAGEDWNMEMAYRWIMHDSRAADLVREGQKKAEDSIKKGSAAKVLGSTPTSAQSKVTKPTPLHKIQGAQAQNKHISDLMDKMGIKFDEE